MLFKNETLKTCLSVSHPVSFSARNASVCYIENINNGPYGSMLKKSSNSNTPTILNFSYVYISLRIKFNQKHEL